MPPSLPLPPLATSLGFFCLFIQVFTLARVFFPPFFRFYLFHPSPPTYKPPFIAAQRLLCSSLCRACCPLSRSCPGSLQSALLPHSLHVPPVLPQTAIMCLSAAQHAPEWRLFSIPPAIYLTLSSAQVEQRHRARSSHVCDGRTARLPAGPPKQPFSGSISHTGMENIYTWCVCNTVGECLMRCLIAAFIFSPPFTFFSLKVEL